MSYLSRASETVGDFDEITKAFAEAVADNFNQPVRAQPEDQLKAPIGEFLRSVGQLSGLTVGWRTEVHADDIDGRPDVGITANGLLTGHVELKRPGMGARADQFTGANRNQWQRFKALPKLIYTDGSEWSLYRSGELKQRARMADDVSKGGASGIYLDSLGAVRELLRDFLYWKPVVPGTTEGLAGFFAPMARILRDQVQKALGTEEHVIEGVVNAAYEAVIPLMVQGPAGQVQDIEAVVDTGFTGFLSLPSGMVVDLGLPFLNASQATLADGSEVTLSVYRAAVLWDGEPRYIRAYAAAAAPLAGMRLLDNRDLSIQVRDGGRVVIQAGE